MTDTLPPAERIVHRMLSVLEDDVLPLTRAGTEAGNKIFGAAILDKTTLDLVIAGTNEETANPLFHGEISCLNKFWALPPQKRPPPERCLFLSTHEPCSLCLSAITWSGFDNFYYLFSYEDSRDAFSIPHDLKILDEVFDCPDGSYRKTNAFWTSYWLMDLIDANPDDSEDSDAAGFSARVEALRVAYNAVSGVYQSSKTENDIPLN